MLAGACRCRPLGVDRGGAAACPSYFTSMAGRAGVGGRVHRQPAQRPSRCRSAVDGHQLRPSTGSVRLLRRPATAGDRLGRRTVTTPGCLLDARPLGTSRRPVVGPVLSRPGTAVSGATRASRPSTAGSRARSARSYASESVFVNQQDDLVDERCVTAVAHTVTHQSTYCDVLGPRSCHRCVKVQRRETAAVVRTDTDHITVVDAVRSALPDVSADTVRTLLAEGKILKTTLRTRPRSRNPTPTSSERDSEPTTRTTATTPLQTLQAQHQRIPPSEARQWRPEIRSILKKFENMTLLNSARWLDVVARQMDASPEFVSMRKSKVIDESAAPVECSGPPLIAKNCQNVDDILFDLHDSRYSLPDRLPDELFTDDSGQEHFMLSAE